MYEKVFISSTGAWHMDSCISPTQVCPKMIVRPGLKPHAPVRVNIPMSWSRLERTAMSESQKSLEREGGTRVLVSDRLQCQTVTHYKYFPPGLEQAAAKQAVPVVQKCFPRAHSATTGLNYCMVTPSFSSLELLNLHKVVPMQLWDFALSFHSNAVQ